MGLYMRFWNNEKCQVEDRCWYSVFLGHATHMDYMDATHTYFKAFKNGIKRLDATRMIKASMDGPGVSYKFYRKLKDERKKLSFPG